ncbi:MAG TPA: thioesterase family protein, partial [Candidatus Obscuribacterales bacterium]
LTIAPHYSWEYPVRVQPHHTDYAGVVWHGTYVAWMEEARVEYLRSRDIDFAHWVACDVDLPVVELSLQYRQPLTLGQLAIVKTWPAPPQGVRLVWHCDIQNQATGATCVAGQVTLVPVSRSRGKVWRQLPAPVKADFARLYPAADAPPATS